MKGTHNLHHFQHCAIAFLVCIIMTVITSHGADIYSFQKAPLTACALPQHLLPAFTITQQWVMVPGASEKKGKMI